MLQSSHNKANSFQNPHAYIWGLSSHSGVARGPQRSAMLPTVVGSQSAGTDQVSLEVHVDSAKCSYIFTSCSSWYWTR